jgi:hypothetical protein
MVKDVAKGAAIGCLGSLGAFGMFVIAALVGLAVLLMVGVGLLYLECGGH